MSEHPRPHLLYVRPNGEGGQEVCIQPASGPAMVEPLTVDSALRFAKSFLTAAEELRKVEARRS